MPGVTMCVLTLLNSCSRYSIVFVRDITIMASMWAFLFFFLATRGGNACVPAA